MKPHEEYMKRAIEVAKETYNKGGVPTGCVVVAKNGEIIAEGLSLVTPLGDPTCHGEVMAIREASKKIGSTNLEGLSLYATLESCGMCMSAALWSNMNAIYFGAFASDVEGNKYEYREYSSIERAKCSQRWDGSSIKVEGGILRSECSDLMKNYKNWQEVKV